MATKRVSIDEYLGSRGYGGVERKAFARQDGTVLKAITVGGVDGVEKAKFNEAAGTMRFVMSAEVEDRDRDIVIQAGLDTGAFERNPVAPWGHKAGDMPVGQWSDIVKSLTGRPKRTEGTLNLTKGEPQADRLAIHLAAGSIRACSIGFMPKEIERRETPENERDEYYYYPGYIIHAAELYECSPVSVPANPAALAKAAAAGDVVASETIQMVLDTWTLENGLVVPRKAFEDAHRQASGNRDVHTIKLGFDTGDAHEHIKALADGAEKAESALSRLFSVFGLKGKTQDAADPAPQQDGPKPAPEPTPEEKLKASLARDLPALEARHKLLDANAREAALDSEMGLHCPA